jgi:hypothetical protein
MASSVKVALTCHKDGGVASHQILHQLLQAEFQTRLCRVFVLNDTRQPFTAPCLLSTTDCSGSALWLATFVTETLMLGSMTVL